MTRYVALLRGVNVGAGTELAMPELSRIVTGLGGTDVRTYLRSGNVVFASEEDPDRLAGRIRRSLADELALDVPVLVRSGAELAALLDGNPYLGVQSDEVKLLVGFLAEPPDPARVAALTVPEGETAEFTFAGRELYLHYPDGFGRSRFSNALLERRLAVAMTIRNWRTVRALAELTAG
ncbi:DUF1697 domain-containing protein [Plantactinospora sp. B5E13]|uniref:DUF1697 domain-containing protein n=1 Tax=Plantactinospora sp. B5E13 TaxID=3153758 RepID=UPI00325D0170